ncbi:DUF6167 family protein [Arthrobacter sp. zg-Y820]|nr:MULTISPECIES: DUF6167 family protein [unclassified Arthrobacter]MCC9196429.1 DUF6167 family protein [Arthrobacter sp. zg-Y820]MDK1279291.1 DUF6167 family protein [Arthrobacter sp. zg.Y820]MDK1359089.1 DUF6167 family protein [Arthrobacter sp. zg-Y1219]WIB11148.1 DUF6167 family protein [Arthrobacter sp. zg-Y820]
MKRVFWMSIGVTIGVIAVRRLSDAKNTLGPAGLNQAIGTAAGALQNFADAFRDGMTEREGELRTALGMDTGDTVADTMAAARR